MSVQLTPTHHSIISLQVQHSIIMFLVLGIYIYRYILYVVDSGALSDFNCFFSFFK